MVITSLGINKNQKKFQPKARPKIVRRPADTQETLAASSESPSTQSDIISEVTTNTAIEPDEKSVTPAKQNATAEIELPSEVTVSQLKPNDTVVESQLLNQPIKEAKPPQNAIRGTSIKAPANVILPPKSAPRGNAIGAPASKPKPQPRPQVEKNDYLDDPENADKPFNILEYLKTHVKKTEEKVKKQKREKAAGNGTPTPKKPRGRPKKTSATPAIQESSGSTNDETSLLENVIGDAPCVSLNEDGSVQQESLPRKRCQAVASRSPEAESVDSMRTDDVLPESVGPVERPKATRRKGYTIPHRELVEAINNYKGTRPLDIEALPIDALCHNVISYGEALETPTVINKRPPPPRKETKTEEVESTPASKNKLAVRFKTVDGELVVDDSHQVSRQSISDETIDYSKMEAVDEGEGGRYYNCMTYVKRISVIRWSTEETDRFYEGLVKWGTDFEMLSREFHNRERRHLVYKFKREEKTNPGRINDALIRRRHTPLSPLAAKDLLI